MRMGSTATASWMKSPSAGRSTPGVTPVGSHSQTSPRSRSSPESHVPQGVAPPEQFQVDPVRMAYASTMSPLRLKRMAPTPERPRTMGISLLET